MFRLCIATRKKNHLKFRSVERIFENRNLSNTYITTVPILYMHFYCNGGQVDENN